MLHFVSLLDFPSCAICSVLNCCVLLQHLAKMYFTGAVTEWRCATHASSVNTHLTRIQSYQFSCCTGGETHASGVNCESGFWFGLNQQEIAGKTPAVHRFLLQHRSKKDCTVPFTPLSAAGILPYSHKTQHEKHLIAFTLYSSIHGLSGFTEPVPVQVQAKVLSG